MMKVVTVIVLSSALLAGAAHTETATFQYDVHGRLIASAKQGGPADGTLTTITHDPADNRSNYAATNVVKTLHVGDKLFSADSQYYLTLKSNGQLAIIAGDGSVAWTSGAGTQAANRASFTSDGNFAIYSLTNSVLWSTSTQGNPGARLTMQTNGDLVIQSLTGVLLWQRFFH